MQTEDNIRPSKLLYVVSIITFVIGIILFVVVLVTGITSSINSIDIQVVVPGTNTIELKESGNYNIYFEHKSTVAGKVFDTSNINGLVCKLKNTETGEYVKLENASTSRYSINGREGQGLFKFTIDKSGLYEIDASYENGEGEQAVLAIGKGFGGNLARTIVLCFVILLGSISASIIIFVHTFNKRRKQKFIAY